MDHDPYADMFRFRIGDCVRYAEHPTQPYSVGQRRWTERAILAPVVEYRLRLGEDGYAITWAYEPDLVLWSEEEG